MMLHAGAVWGVFGFAMLLAQAIYRMLPLAIEPLVNGMSSLEWGLYGASVVFMGFTEGYRAFQLQASPRVVARALHLASNPRPIRVALAPLFCMGLFGATRRRLITSWCITAAIVVVIIAVKQLPQPWRGIIDAGVVVGLSWGLIALLYYFARGVQGRAMPVPSDVPDTEQATM